MSINIPQIHRQPWHTLKQTHASNCIKLSQGPGHEDYTSSLRLALDGMLQDAEAECESKGKTFRVVVFHSDLMTKVRKGGKSSRHRLTHTILQQHILPELSVSSGLPSDNLALYFSLSAEYKKLRRSTDAPLSLADLCRLLSITEPHAPDSLAKECALMHDAVKAFRAEGLFASIARYDSYNTSSPF